MLGLVIGPEFWFVKQYLLQLKLNWISLQLNKILALRGSHFWKPIGNDRELQFILVSSIKSQQWKLSWLVHYTPYSKYPKIRNWGLKTFSYQIWIARYWKRKFNLYSVNFVLLCSANCGEMKNSKIKTIYIRNLHIFY